MTTISGAGAHGSAEGTDRVPASKSGSKGYLTLAKILEYVLANLPGGGGAGTVTSVGMSCPTGLQVSGSPVTESGTLALAYQSGYQGFTAAEASKLSGIASGATQNSSDATLLARSNHTGSQAISTVTGLQTALDGKAASSHNHDDRYYTEGEVDSLLSGKANSSHGIHVPTGGSTGQVLKKASSSDGDLTWAADNVGEGGGGGDMYVSVYDPQEIEADAFDRANHTGEQAISTVTGLQTALDGKSSTSHNHNGTYQPLDATLTDFAAQTIAADKLVYGDGSDSFAVTDFTAAARTLLAQSTIPNMRATGLKIVTISEASYEALNPPDSDTLYFITDAE